MVHYVEFRLFPVLLLMTAGLWSCGKTSPSNDAKKADNSNRCVLTDIGEAADFIQRTDIADDAWVVAQGVANPQALVWRDAETNKTFYLARVLGTQKRLYFLREIPEGETPGVPTTFKGHLLRWDHLPAKQAANMAGGLKSTYNVTLAPAQTFVIIEGAKPSGCQ